MTIYLTSCYCNTVHTVVTLYYPFTFPLSGNHLRLYSILSCPTVQTSVLLPIFSIITQKMKQPRSEPVDQRRNSKESEQSQPATPLL